MRSSASPEREDFVLAALILVASVAHLNLAAATWGCRRSAQPFVASETGIYLIAVGYSLDLSASYAQR